VVMSFLVLFSFLLFSCFTFRYLKLDADGFHWYEDVSGPWLLFGGQTNVGRHIGTLPWKHVQGATRAGPWKQYVIYNLGGYCAPHCFELVFYILMLRSLCPRMFTQTLGSGNLPRWRVQ
jgi:hypothetical protein